MKQDHELTDAELAETVRRKQRDIQNYRRERGEPRPLKDTLVGLAKSGKQKKKNGQQESNEWEGPKDKFTIIPNEFIEATYKQSFGPNQHKVLWYLVRKTWGWKKRSEFIRVIRCAEELKIPKQRVSEALSSLLKRRIVTVNRDKTYAIQADISLWRNPYRKKEGKYKDFDEEP